MSGRCFFYITNDRTSAAEAVVFQGNDRCDQENLIAQLKSGVRALTTPVDNLISNGAYMVMASVAWSLKAWSALLVPVTPRHAATHRAEQRAWLRMEFATFRAAVIEMPCQLIRSGGRLIVSNGQGGHNYFGGSGPDRNQWVSVKWLPPEWLGSRMDRS